MAEIYGQQFLDRPRWHGFPDDLSYCIGFPVNNWQLLTDINYDKPNTFYGLFLLSQAGLMGVFVAMDALHVLFLLGACANTRLFSQQYLGWRKANSGNI